MKKLGERKHKKGQFARRTYHHGHPKPSPNRAPKGRDTNGVRLWSIPARGEIKEGRHNNPRWETGCVVNC